MVIKSIIFYLKFINIFNYVIKLIFVLKSIMNSLGANWAWSWWACAWDVGFSTYVVANLGSWSGLGSTFSFFVWAVLSFWFVVVFFEYWDWSWDIEGSFGDQLFLGRALSFALGFTYFSLISNGVFIWDDNVLGSNLGLWSSWFRGKFGKWSRSWCSWEDGILWSNASSSWFLNAYWNNWCASAIGI